MNHPMAHKHHKVSKRSATTAVSVIGGPAAAITERYRPRTLAEVVGQTAVIDFLRYFVAQPYSVAVLFEGETGTGKSSTALALAAELGCDVEHGGFGGVHMIASGEQNAESVRQTYELMRQTPMLGSGWKVIIGNEADRISPAAETIWLDRLEALPPRTVVVFTTNFANRLPQRFRDRCVSLRFDSDAAKLEGDARDLARRIWMIETGQFPCRSLLQRLLAHATDQERLSFRRLLHALQKEMVERNLFRNARSRL